MARVIHGTQDNVNATAVGRPDATAAAGYDRAPHS